jgi:Ca2+-binding EF-hand superfamily protein
MQTSPRYLLAILMAIATPVLAGGERPPGPPSVKPIETFDLNDDGTVTKEEFATASATQVAELEANFLEKFDSIPDGATAGDGIITPAEYQAVQDAAVADWLADLLEKYDTNDDGAISSADQSTSRGRKHVIEEYDANDDGTVSKEELLAAADEKADALEARFIKKYDSIPDGATAGDGTITAAESEAVFQGIVDDRVASILERFDANDDGTVTADEITAVQSTKPKHAGGKGGGHR